MSVKPILFNTEMVRAILDGSKTVTRRVIKPQPIHEDGFWKLGGAAWSDNINNLIPISCHSLYNRLPYKPGDILYVRETWWADKERQYFYRADGIYPQIGDNVFPNARWRPSIHMPKEAARIWLKVTDVRLERLQDSISRKPQQTIDNISAEGIHLKAVMENYDVMINEWKELWDSTIPKQNIDKYGWYANPWVWVIEFGQCEKPQEV